MEIKKLETWASLLLDTGKRNNLINFKDSKASSVEILIPDAESMLSKTESSTQFEVYDPKIADEEPLEEETETAEAIMDEYYAEPEEEEAEEAEFVDEERVISEIEEENEVTDSETSAEKTTEAVAVKSMGDATEESIEDADREMAEDDAEDGIEDSEEDDAEETKEEKPLPVNAKVQYLAQYGPKLKKAHQILAYNASTNPVAAVKNIAKKTATIIEETGVNVAYLAFGFIHWKEKGFDREFAAPILLAPVEFRNESAIEPWYIRMTENDIIVNPTFSFKLEHELGIVLPRYEDEGLSVYLEKVEQMVSKLGWRVSGECKLGTFSFLKLNMYQDLMKNQKRVLENSNVRILLGEDPSAIMALEDEAARLENPLMELHNVVNADSSQLEAIQMAKQGKSFVLQGPPGTGKSQTITNIIAECLSDGKKVLFVSEKLAALNVVYNKLKKAGLEEFCLELHSYKANKKDFINNLCHTLRTPKQSVSSKAEEELLQKLEAQMQLDTYEEALHKKREPIDLSLYQMYGAYADCKSAPNADITLDEIETKGKRFLINAKELLGNYKEFIPFTGYDYRTSHWYGYRKQNTSARAVAEMKEHMQLTAEGAQKLKYTADRIADDYEVQIETMDEIARWCAFFKKAADSHFLNASWMGEISFGKLCEDKDMLMQKSQELLGSLAQIEAEYDADILKVDAASNLKLLERKYTGFFSRLTSGEYRSMISDIRLCHKKGKKPSYEEAVAIMTKAAAHQEKMAGFEAAAEETAAIIGKEYKGIHTDWERLSDEIDTMKLCYGEKLQFGRIADMSSDEFAAEKNRFLSLAKNIEAIEAPMESHVEELERAFAPEQYEVRKAAFDSLSEKLVACADDMGTIDHWCRMASVLERMKELEILPFLHQVMDQEMAEDQFVGAFEKMFYGQWIDEIIHKNQVLAMFSRTFQDHASAVFHEKDEVQFAISKVQIRAELSGQRPSLDMIAPGSGLATVLREGEKKRKQKSIRTLLEETGELVQRIKPCFLMSPLSVSTYLSNESIRFDVVIFDEASQIFPQDAIGAIYRGSQLIVVGDSRQMPPSNFFNNTVESVDDEEVGDITDFESILDICSASFRQLRLKWHYRSRFEELIAFSNRYFYDNDLVTFPSACENQPGCGVEYYHVDGVFEHKARTNKAEAMFIVDLIYDHIERYPKRSLGVVAFSIAQQDLIERLLSKRRQDDPSKEFFFKKDVEEPFFIKNLETVQGDERDTIIFSVAYGKDSAGKLLHNFGPLNQAGGERRLNVAITRAKMNVCLVSSMHHTDIDLTKTKAEGAKLLRTYLDYAENGTGAIARQLSVDPLAEFDSEFEEEVYNFLTEQGYTVDKQVGCSNFRIDLGLRRPDTSDYVLAIECDGATYHSAKNARDRDWLRQSILENMGWRFHRIWSTEWFKNTEDEKRYLLEAVEAALAVPEEAAEEVVEAVDVAPEVRTVPVEEETAPAPETKEISFEETVIEEHFEFPKYQKADELEVFKKGGTFLEMVKEILDTEAPLSEEWLMRRMLFYFRKTKVTNVVQEQFEQEMYGAHRYGIVRRDGFLYLENSEPLMLRVPDGEKRDVKYIANDELASGIREIMKRNVQTTKDGLYHQMANLLGYTRVGDAMAAKLEQALLILGDEIEVNEQNVTWKD